MNRHVNAIAGRLSLRAPQRKALEILDRVTEIIPTEKGADTVQALEVIFNEFPSVTDFEREFPSLCFALATGVGKTRLMGAFISYLHLAHGIKNFFVLAPNLTIYNKLIADFTPNTPKYVFKGISEFAIEPPAIITGDNYEQIAGTLFDQQFLCKVNIFNIAKINSEVRGGRSPKVKRLSEYLGESYFAYLSQLQDLVLLMDESHRYRASAGVKAINELKPVLGLELTATPVVETSRGAVPFKNVILHYPLSKAMADGFVKEPAVVTRKDFNSAGMSVEQLEQMKLEDGIRLHESVKVQLQTYARDTGDKVVKPFVLVIARDTTHARQLLERVEAEDFFSGAYRGKVIQVDSSRTGADEEEMIAQLLQVERRESPIEIVIHVNMLKEGWDVTNLYTIVPLRAANARVLIEQSIGRGLRLPYGKRTGVLAVDRLNIVAHDRFQEIVDEANKPGSVIQMGSVVLDPQEMAKSPVTVVSPPVLSSMLGIQPPQVTGSTVVAGSDAQPVFVSKEEQAVAELALQEIQKLARRPDLVPGTASLSRPEVQAEILRAVTSRYQPPVQQGLEGIVEPPDFAAVVAKTAELVQQKTIAIPKIMVVPRGDVRSGFKPFDLVLNMRYQAISEELWAQHLRTGQVEVLAVGRGGGTEKRLEDYVVSGLVDFDDVSYDDNAELLYDLAGQTVRHFLSYLTEEDTRRVLQANQKEIAREIHSQMQEHFWEDATGYEVVVSQGFTELRPSAYTRLDPELSYLASPGDKSNMGRYLFGGFQYCLYAVQKFQSDAERKLAVILEREQVKWFKPAKGQFQMYYRSGADHLEYQPDFVAETADCIYMLEPKAANEMTDPVVLAKRDAAVLWCSRASEHGAKSGGKPWMYVLIPHDAISVNMTLGGLVGRYGCRAVA